MPQIGVKSYLVLEVRMNEHTPSPDLIYKINTQARETAAMFAGMELDLFTPLDKGPLNPEELAEVLGVNAEKLDPLLYALAVYGLLEEQDGYFSNTPVTSHFLVRGKKDYIGESAKIWKNNVLAALTTAETVRTGIPQSKYDWCNMEQDRLEELMEGMGAHDYTFARWLTEKFDFSACKSLLDVGCGSGMLAVAMTEINPQMQATVVDFPEVTPITRKTVRNANAEEKVKVISADAVKDPIPGEYDAAILSSIIQVVSPEEARKIILNIGSSVKSGGWMYIFGSGIIRDSKLSPLAAVGINLVLITVYDRGRAFTESEHTSWLREAGFNEIEFNYDEMYIAAQKG
jgi:2-polyprenyl-3-methyl-5-hydroxy-6-metoxy-1,4-benzoquinol methylase